MKNLPSRGRPGPMGPTRRHAVTGRYGESTAIAVPVVANRRLAGEIASGGGEEGAEGLEGVGLGGGLVEAPAEDAGEADGDPRLVAGRALEPFEGQLEDEVGLDGADGAELLDHVAADEGVDPADLLVGQPRIRLGDG